MTRNHYQRVRTREGRRENITISGCSSPDEVEARCAIIRDVADQLTAAGRHDRVKDICAQIGAAASTKLVATICRGVHALIERQSAAPDAVTVRALGDDWTSGELHKRFPDYVRAKKTSSDDASKLRLYVYPVVGSVAVPALTLDDAQRVMSKLPGELSSATRRHVAQVMYKLLRYAVYPCKLIAHSPLPIGFLPKVDNRKAKQYLYPEEDRRLLACIKIPLETRLAYGVLAREGMRTGELIGSYKDGTEPIDWSEIDLDRGMVRLDENKTDDPRAWALRPDVVRALAIWRERSPRATFPNVDRNHTAETFRRHLILAGIVRSELTSKETAARRPIRAHDLRATFITIAMATGKSESWIQDRTGHTSSAMLNRYKRMARQFRDLALGELGPLDRLVPELAQVGDGAQRRGRKVGEVSETKRAKLG